MEVQNKAGWDEGKSHNYGWLAHSHSERNGKWIRVFRTKPLWHCGHCALLIWDQILFFCQLDSVHFKPVKGDIESEDPVP